MNPAFLFSYGLVASVFAHAPEWALVVFVLVNREDDGLARAGAAAVGALVGVALVAALRTPRLVDVRTFFGWDAVRAKSAPPVRGSLWDPLVYAWTGVFVVGWTALAVGGTAAMRAHGVGALLLLFFGLAFVVLGGVQLWVTRLPTGLPGRLNLKYLAFGAALVAGPPAAAARATAHPSVAAFLVLLAVYPFLYAVGGSDVLLGAPNRGRAATALPVLALVHGTALAAGASTTVRPDLAVAAVGAAWFVILLACLHVWNGGSGSSAPVVPSRARTAPPPPSPLPNAAVAFANVFGTTKTSDDASDDTDASTDASTASANAVAAAEAGHAAARGRRPGPPRPSPPAGSKYLLE